MTKNTVFIMDFIIVSQDGALVTDLHQGMHVACPNEIKRKRRLYGYDFH